MGEAYQADRADEYQRAALGSWHQGLCFRLISAGGMERACFRAGGLGAGRLLEIDRGTADRTQNLESGRAPIAFRELPLMALRAS